MPHSPHIKAAKFLAAAPLIIGPLVLAGIALSAILDPAARRPDSPPDARLMRMGKVLDACIVTALLGLSWHLPRRHGTVGLLAAQLLAAAGFGAMIPIALLTGLWQPGDYDGAGSVFGCLLFAVAFNFVCLPLGIVAVLRHRHRPMQRTGDEIA